MMQVPRNSEKSKVLGSDSSDSSLDHMVPWRFYSKVTYDEHTNEYRYLSTSDVVQLWDKRNIIFHEASKVYYLFHKTVGHLITVEIETCPVETRFILCKDKMIR